MRGQARTPKRADRLRWPKHNGGQPASRDARAASNALAPDELQALLNASSFNAAGWRMVMPPRSIFSHLRSCQARSCLFVLSRDMPMIWPTSRWVIVTLRPSGVDFPASDSQSSVLASRRSRSRKMTSST